ncbi:MAG: carboxylating nicotinate-nucleotide diphosphorylase [Candidatus Bathyarchaeota archaeon]|nr:carboxylating nicotinate-nucleotide diphosphorylase [Candidatus Bathyarchaeota archaeon]MDW8040251.1 carboxylating nicotinate-nucleotide diphosphorylase [Nitrososphaerota archaeon]
MFLPKKILEEKLRQMLAEDLGQGDITTAILIPEGCTAEAEIIAKEAGIVAGMDEAKTLLESVGLKFETYVVDGDKIEPKQVLMKIFGDARIILSVERTLLNIISRMSGIATITRELVDKVQKAGYKTKVACTRKTAPGLLYFDKKAVFIGGGDPHRFHLDDMILVKDNHIAVVGGVEQAIEAVRKKASFSKKIEVEIAKVEDVLRAAEAGADVIMLDNFSPKQVEEAVKILKKAGYYGKVVLEASGGITAGNIIDYAAKGVDIISLGEITHSVKALDISLEITKVKRAK